MANNMHPDQTAPKVIRVHIFCLHVNPSLKSSRRKSRWHFQDKKSSGRILFNDFSITCSHNLLYSAMVSYFLNYMDYIDSAFNKLTCFPCCS